MEAPVWLVAALVCPVCRGALAATGEILGHASGSCTESYPVIDGIPRLLRGGARAELVRARHDRFETAPELRALAEQWMATAPTHDAVVFGFEHEWSRHPEVGSDAHRKVFEMYMDVVPADAFSEDHLVLDAGCGSGRWAFEVARRGPRVIALDLGLSVETAVRNAAPTGRVAGVQADVIDCPIAPGALDWLYSLGVLHHVRAVETALKRMSDAVRAGGSVLLYLYYALDGRGPGYRAAFRAVNALRRVTSRMPRPAVAAFADAVALLVYWPLARASHVLSRVGASEVAEGLPLSFYRDLPLRMMRNDSLDRFGTSVERRFTRAQFIHLLEEAGLVDVRVSDRPPYWHGLARRPRSES